MKFSTPVEIPSSKTQFCYGSNFFTLGSCFAGHLAEKFQYFGFSQWHNPVGILFHPYAIEQFCCWLDHQPIEKKLYVQHQDSWKSYQVHSQLHASSPEELTQQIEEAIRRSIAFIQKSDAIFITLGTSIVYKHISTNSYVANCQKQPQQLFEKELINPDLLEKSLNNTIQILRKLSKANIYFSVSPVRHLKEGIVQNNLSKSNLVSAVHQAKASNKGVFYMPTFEIVMDELRDYRFYQRDLIHPNDLAVDYIWEKFSHAFLDEKTLKLMKKVNAFRKLSQHRVLNSSLENHAKHQEKIQLQREALVKLEPQLHI